MMDLLYQTMCCSKHLSQHTSTNTQWLPHEKYQITCTEIIIREKPHSIWIGILLVSYCVLSVNSLNTVLHEHVHNCNWINQLSNTTIWWLDICCLLHRYQLHVSPLMAIFRLIDWQQTCKQLYFGMRRVYGGGGLGLDGGTRSGVCWVGRVMWVHSTHTPTSPFWLHECNQKIYQHVKPPKYEQ